MPRTKKEVKDVEFLDLLSSSASVIKSFLADHPEVLYKGVPLAVALYIFSPLLLTVWEWLPWLWASWEIYRRVPSGTITAILEVAKRCSAK